MRAARQQKAHISLQRVVGRGGKKKDLPAFRFLQNKQQLCCLQTRELTTVAPLLSVR